MKPLSRETSYRRFRYIRGGREYRPSINLSQNISWRIPSEQGSRWLTNWFASWKSRPRGEVGKPCFERIAKRMTSLFLVPLDERWVYVSVWKNRKVVDMVMDQGYFWQMLVRIGKRKRRRRRRRRYFKFLLRYSATRMQIFELTEYVMV